MMQTIGRLAVLPVTALALAGCPSGSHDSGKKETAPAPTVSGVILETVKAASVPETVELSGTVRARTSAVVSSRVPGVIVLLKVREGDQVRKGQQLLQLEAPENQASAAAATAGTEEARRALDEALVRKKLADATYDRYQKLYGEQAVTRQEFEVRQTDRDLAAQGVARAEARLRQTQESARAASAMADYTRIAAPVSGVVTSRQADTGSTVFPGQPLMTIEGEGGYQLELAVPESLAAKVAPGTPVTVSLDSRSGTFPARVAEVVPAADPSSRTFTVKVPLTQPGLKSGMFGRGSLASGSGTSGITVPRTALFERGALTAVWTVDSSSSARMRLVKAGKPVGDRIEVLAGLGEGDRIIAATGSTIVEGARIGQ